MSALRSLRNIARATYQATLVELAKPIARLNAWNDRGDAPFVAVPPSSATEEPK